MATLPRTEHAVAQRLAETVDPGEALTGALAAIGESLGWHVGAVWEPAPHADEALRCTMMWHAPGIDIDPFEAATCSLLLGRGDGLPGRVWDTGEPVWITDVLEDDNFPRAEAARAAGLRGAVAFPLRTATGVLGAIEFFAPDPHSPDAELMATLGTIGHQVGQAVERRRDAERLRGQEARLRA